MAYNSILNHNWLPIAVRVNWGDYWDFQLADRRLSSSFSGGLSKDCLSAYIDTEDDDCVDNGSLFSKRDYVWSKSVNNGLKFENIGSTGVDNGLITFDKTTITEEDFNNLYNHSVFEIEKDDKRLRLNSVSGNNRIYYYGSEIVETDGIMAARLNGGFYQGFFRVGDGCDYNVLPSVIDTSWGCEVVLKRCDFENESELPRMFDKNPDNKGLFLYFGTRAENKWWIDYNNDGSDDEGNQPIKDMESEIVTDNKFLIFDRTKDGLTVYDVKDDEDITAIITMKEGEELADNPFLVYHRGKDGICVNDEIPESLEKKEKYDVYGDLYNNALAFMIRDDGSIGYKYLVRDCESDDKKYKIESEFSYKNIVPYGQWTIIHIRIDTNTPYPLQSYNSVGSSGLKMRIRIYVNGRLVFVSRELEGLKFRNLNDMDSRQEGVAFNISLGGGTQGLGDVIYGDYEKLPEHVLPLQENFGGSFSGYIKSFRFYNCGLTFDRILSNSRFELKVLKRQMI